MTKRTTTTRTRRGITRRRWLQGACSTLLALPMLDYFRASRAAAVPAPPRLLVYSLPNGRRAEWWVPAPYGPTIAFPAQASALQPFADRALSLVGLDNTAARRSPGAAHAMGNGTIMTGTAIPDLIGIKNGISLDQIVADEVESATRFKSLQWSAGEPGPCDVGGASCAYTQSISWAGPGQPLAPTIDPASAFDRLFHTGTDGLSGAPGEVRKRSIRSVLDFVRDDAQSLQGRLGREDRARLDQYFTSLRQLERSLATDAPASACSVPVDGPATSLGYPERVQAFHELITLAFQCDQTRVLSFMIEFGLSGRSHDFLGAPGAHHALSHFGSPEQYLRLAVVEQWHAEQVADLLGRLAGVASADGRTLLDDTVVLVIPDMGEGSSHDHAHNAPLMFGGKDVINATGRQIAVPGRPLADLHVSLLKAYGIAGAFGPAGAIFGDDGTSEIAGLVT